MTTQLLHQPDLQTTSTPAPTPSAPGMRYLVSTCSRMEHVRDDIQIMIGPRVSGIQPILEGRLFGIDCDAFSTQVRYDDAVYFAHLERLMPHARQALFAVVPDLPGDGQGTLSAFDHYAPFMAEFGFPLAYVMQDGAERLDLPRCDAVFLGGSDTWREACGAVMIERARAEGRYVHVGRVNSHRRMLNLAVLDADSADGTYLSYRGVKRGLEEIGGWLNAAQAPRLFQAGDVQALALSLERVLSLRGASGAARGDAGSPGPGQVSLFGADLPLTAPDPAATKAAGVRPSRRYHEPAHLDVAAFVDYCGGYCTGEGPTRNRGKRR